MNSKQPICLSILSLVNENTKSLIPLELLNARNRAFNFTRMIDPNYRVDGLLSNVSYEEICNDFSALHGSSEIKFFVSTIQICIVHGDWPAKDKQGNGYMSFTIKDKDITGNEYEKIIEIFENPLQKIKNIAIVHTMFSITNGTTVIINHIKPGSKINLFLFGEFTTTKDACKKQEEAMGKEEFKRRNGGLSLEVIKFLELNK